MPSEIVVYEIGGHHRSHIVCQAMMEGIRRVTGKPPLMKEASRFGRGDARVMVFYGYQEKLTKAFEWQAETGGAAVYIDLGYFGRREGGRYRGYHKIVVGARHPTAYFQRTAHDGSRAAHFDVRPEKWKSGGKHVLLAGMGAKGALAEGLQPFQWEREAIAEIRKHTDRPIIYRPKPSCKLARPIEGVGWSPHTEDAEVVLRDAHAVVTHHSNVAVDGLMAGIPCFAWSGVATPLALSDLSRIEEPIRPEGREQWFQDLAFTQWAVWEMREGLPWKHLKEEGLIP